MKLTRDGLALLQYSDNEIILSFLPTKEKWEKLFSPNLRLYSYPYSVSKFIKLVSSIQFGHFASQYTRAEC